MVREIVHDPIFLAQKSVPATAADAGIADDLMDTLKVNAERCVGMAANMIGEAKCIIVFCDEGNYVEMFNPVILRAQAPYETEEGCLSLSGVRKTKRYQKIKVQWQTRDMQQRVKNFSGWSAEIIQHELDHCGGVLI